MIKNRFVEDQPFLLRKFRDPVFDPATGMTNCELHQALAARVAEWDDLPRPVGKARVFEFICDHMAIAVGPHDLFPAFACHDRHQRPFDMVKRHWDGILNQRLKHWPDTEAGNRVGHFTMWKDFDHSVPDWDDTLRLGFAGILRRALEAKAQHAAAGTLDAAARAYFDGIEITYRCIFRTLTRFADLARAEAAAADDPRRLRVAASIEAVRDHEPRSLYEVLQFIYFYFMFSEHVDYMQVRSLGNMDRQGVTALIRSMTTLDPLDFPGDFPLDVMLLTATVQDEDGLAAMETLVKTYMDRGGWAIHFNIFSPDEMIEAQRHPEKYEGLQVRVCGWNARFNDMEKREQDAYIASARNLTE